MNLWCKVEISPMVMVLAWRVSTVENLKMRTSSGATWTLQVFYARLIVVGTRTVVSTHASRPKCHTKLRLSANLPIQILHHSRALRPLEWQTYNFRKAGVWPGRARRNRESSCRRRRSADTSGANQQMWRARKETPAASTCRRKCRIFS